MNAGSQPPVPANSTPATSAPGECMQERLWLCLYLPRLPLEVFARAAADIPLAVLADEKHKPVILLCNDVAARCGVRPGMPVNAALALSPGLEVCCREPAREQHVLHELAALAMRFTPLVSLESSGALLLEIAASLKLFGGPDALRAAAVEQAGARGHRVMTAVAPTARAALWLARLGHETPITDPAHLAGVLGRIPISHLGWPRLAQQSLHRIGVKQLSECMRLPRDGMARRIGESCLLEIDEALGRCPELRQACRQSMRFRDELELPAETRETGRVLDALRILLSRLRDHLLARQAGAQILWVQLRHGSAPATLLRIGLLRPRADVAHLEELAAIHLSATRVPAPVMAIALEADVADLAHGMGEDLLGLDSDRGERLAGLVERLRMRLGLHAVHGIWPGRGHRPEHAWCAISDPGAGRPWPGETGSNVQRPLWILECPALLSERAGEPLFHGQLALERSPERIETGWWDGQDVRRDYYVGGNPRGMRVWVFKDLRSGSWYLHGLFG